MNRSHLQALLLSLLLALWLPTAALAGQGRGLVELHCAVRDAAWVRGATCAEATCAVAGGVKVATPGSRDFFRYWSEFTSNARAEDPSAAVVVLDLRPGGERGAVGLPSPIGFLRGLARGDF